MQKKIGCGLLGTVIFTEDDTKFMVGDYYIMYDIIDTFPTSNDVTYILRTNKFTEKDIIKWLPYITNRLIVTTTKPPRITNKTKEYVIIDKSATKRNIFLSGINLLFKSEDRLRAWHQIQHVPIPYALSFVNSNNNDIELWRRIAKSNMWLPDFYTKSILAYGIEPKRKTVQWPNKKKNIEIPPTPFRVTDKYWEDIILSSAKVANNVRLNDKENLPSKAKKTMECEDVWI